MCGRERNSPASNTTLFSCTTLDWRRFDDEMQPIRSLQPASRRSLPLPIALPIFAQDPHRHNGEYESRRKLLPRRRMSVAARLAGTGVKKFQRNTPPGLPRPTRRLTIRRARIFSGRSLSHKFGYFTETLATGCLPDLLRRASEGKSGCRERQEMSPLGGRTTRASPAHAGGRACCCALKKTPKESRVQPKKPAAQNH